MRFSHYGARPIASATTRSSRRRWWRRARGSDGTGRLRSYVQDRLAGRVEAPAGQTVPGPDVAWGSRRHGRRKDRRWATAWSPEQITGRLPMDFPDDESMRISHEAIYQGLYVEGRGGLRRELTACLR